MTVHLLYAAGILAISEWEIERSIPKLSTKVLAKELKELELNKLINRTIIEDYPIRIEYTITEHGKSLQMVIETLHQWGVLHRKEIFEE